jgi:DNA (cytosine-5)-methyltransferase 1
MKLLDLFCCGGGASMGYYNVGFEILGVDIKKKRNYPFKQLKFDVFDLFKKKSKKWFQQFDLIHASPPCQKFSRAAKGASWGKVSEIDLISELRKELEMLKIPYVIENVQGSPLLNPIMLCGSMFNLKVRRHRIFESNFEINTSNLNCNHKKQGKPIGIYGSMNDTVKGVCSKTGKTVYGGSTAKSLEEAREAMGINWLNWGDLKEAIPPRYTEFIGHQFIKNYLRRDLL